MPELATEPSLADGREVAVQLHSLAADERFAGRRKQLQSLARAVSTPTVNDRGWEAVDLFDAFSPESTITVRGRAHTLLDGIAGLLAAIAVFLPVAWTWFAMSKASGAYRDLLAAGGGADQSFLQLWVTGFDGRLDPVHHLPSMALISVFLILTAIMAVILQRTVANRRTAVEAEQFQSAEVQLHEALTQATRLLSIKPVSTNEDFNALVTRSIRELNRAHEETAKSTDRLRDTFEAAGASLDDALARVEPLLADVKATTGTIGDAARTMEVAAKETERATSGAVARLATDITASSEHWRSSHLMAVDASGSVMAKASESLTRSANDLTAIADQLSRNVAELNGAGKSVPAMLTTAMQSALADTAREIREAAPAFDRSTAQMTHSLEDIDRALVMNQSAVQAQVSELTQARDALGQILRELRSMTASLERSQRRASA